ncbi:MAG TPA: hypothetical protein VKJ00_00240, partial [Thermoanaerobaculia bacterium]|nr:hypothetical protein [Thermoanaerobaculia bacterium]
LGPEGGFRMAAKKAKKSGKKAGELPSRSLSARQAKGVRGGTISKVPGRLKWENITLKRGIT